MTNQPTAKDGDMIAQANKVMAKERELKKTLAAPHDASVEDIVADFVPDPLSAKHVLAGIVPAEAVDDLIEAEIHRMWSEPHDDHPAGLASIVSAPETIFERTDEEMARDTKPFDPSKPLKRIDKIAKY